MRRILVRLTIFNLLVSGSLISAPGMAQKKIHYTYPMPRPVKPADPLNVNPGFQVPEFQDNYQFVSAPSKYMGTEEIGVFSLDGGRRAKIGTMPPGTAIKMTSITVVGKTIYYAVPWQIPGAGRPQFAWVSGLNIKASAFNPSVK
jgi:hypothetical protein